MIGTHSRTDTEIPQQVSCMKEFNVTSQNSRLVVHHFDDRKQQPTTQKHVKADRPNVKRILNSIENQISAMSPCLTWREAAWFGGANNCEGETLTFRGGGGLVLGWPFVTVFSSWINRLVVTPPTTHAFWNDDGYDSLHTRGGEWSNLT